MNLFTPINLDIKNKYRNLDIEAKGEVKSTKYFPVFLKDGEEYIFKPLSKTKPFTTPLFAFSEVFWSYIIKKIFDTRAPLYQLAYCKGLTQEQPKYTNQGTLVKSVLKKNQEMINLLEIFNEYPEENVNISDYINYCMHTYDYTKILKSEFFKNHYELGQKLAFQILLSVLRQDQNFHYENVNFIKENNQIIDIAPPIDFEFSTAFLYPDQPSINESYKKKYLTLPEPFDFKDCIHGLEIKGWFDPKAYTIAQNIIVIVKLFPDVATDFVEKLEYLLIELDKIEIMDEANYITKLNSASWQIGHARYKNNDEEAAKEYESKIIPVDINKEEFFQKIIDDNKENTEKLIYVLKVYLHAYENNIINIERIPFSTLEEIYKDQRKRKLKGTT